MSTNKSRRALTVLFTLAILFSMFSSAVLAAPSTAAPAVPVSFTILHTNDFHGQLEPSGSNPGSARVATYVNGVRTALGASNVLLVDAGDEMQGSLLSNLGDGTPTGKGIPTSLPLVTMSLTGDRSILPTAPHRPLIPTLLPTSFRKIQRIAPPLVGLSQPSQTHPIRSLMLAPQPASRWPSLA